MLTDGFENVPSVMQNVPSATDFFFSLILKKQTS